MPAALKATMHATLRFLTLLDAAAAVYGEFGLPYGRCPANGPADVADPGLNVEADQDHEVDEGQSRWVNDFISPSMAVTLLSCCATCSGPVPAGSAPTSASSLRT
ncbi:hypothetical protein [Streptosporangium sp. NPDC006930]|uniref:hypothetical protein n=1 Tax=unclassified Streptosporangium TaxID=2632669 RepID=UPI00343C8352